uniref:Macro domain-containing protein n=1 Tax=Kalanchoe fedtschenkoi TaxID=63787 RepID=A0A7N0VLQ2_KALFE
MASLAFTQILSLSRNSLRVAKENSILYIAFPTISCGVYRYPHDKAAIVSISTVKEFAKEFKEIHFVLYTEDIFKEWLKKAKKRL